jgi:hypothetical protein
LDEAFGITNDKQRVRPIEDFWRILHDEGIDDVLNREQSWQGEQRRKAKVAASQPVASPEPTPAEMSAAVADKVVGVGTGVPEHEKPRAQATFEEAVKQRAAVTQDALYPSGRRNCCVSTSRKSSCCWTAIGQGVLPPQRSLNGWFPEFLRGLSKYQAVVSPTNSEPTRFDACAFPAFDERGRLPYDLISGLGRWHECGPAEFPWVSCKGEGACLSKELF